MWWRLSFQEGASRGSTDKIDNGGSVTIRHNSRLYHTGLGTRLAGTPITLLVDNLRIRVIHRYTGALIRELILDPSRDYQPRGLTPRATQTKQCSHTTAGIPIPTKPRHQSRSQGWPQATRSNAA